MYYGRGPIEKRELKHFEYRICVAGSRGYDDMEEFSHHVFQYLHGLGINAPKEHLVVFITGVARTGADDLIRRWCIEHGYPWAEYPALWDDLDAPGAVIRIRRDGQPYNVKAGFARNATMRDVSTDLVLFWDGQSGGTKHMHSICEAHGLNIEIVKITIKKAV